MNTSSKKKRQRGENWLEEDKIILQLLVKERISIIENKNVDSNTNAKKAAAWQDLLTHFNAKARMRRTVPQVKAQWSIMKMQVKRQKFMERSERLLTGGEPPPPSEPPSGDDITALLPTELLCDYNEFDSDGQYFKTLWRDKAQKSIQAGQPGKIIVPTNSEKRLYKSLESLPSTSLNSTGEQLNNTTDAIKNSSLQSVVQETNCQSIAQDKQERKISVTVEEESVDEPLVSVKVETHWTDDSHSRDSCMEDDNLSLSTRNESLEPTVPPSKPEVPLNPDFTKRKEEEYKLTERSIERAEELHKLKVAEKVWLLKTLRERHATARLERERAQLERDRARLERDHAQLCRDKAQLDLDRAKQDDTDYDF